MRFNFKKFKFVDAIIDFMNKNHINKFSFKRNLLGGYSLKFIKNNKFIFDSVDFMRVETCEEFLKKLEIKKPFKIMEIYETKKIKSLELLEIKNKLNNEKYLKLIKIYYDSKMSYLYKSNELNEYYNFLLIRLSHKYESLILLEACLNDIVNNSYEELIFKIPPHIKNF